MQCTNNILDLLITFGCNNYTVSVSISLHGDGTYVFISSCSIEPIKSGCLYGFLFFFVNSEYDQEIPQSQTTDKPMAPRGRAT